MSKDFISLGKDIVILAKLKEGNTRKRGTDDVLTFI